MKAYLPLNWAPSPGFRGLCSPSHNIIASAVGGRGLKDCPLFGFILIIPKASLGERQWLLLRPQRGQIRLSGSGFQRQRSILEGGCFKYRHCISKPPAKYPVFYCNLILFWGLKFFHVGYSPTLALYSSALWICKWWSALWGHYLQLWYSFGRRASGCRLEKR